MKAGGCVGLVGGELVCLVACEVDVFSGTGERAKSTTSL